MRRLANIPGITFALYFVWKVLLLVFTAQPIPSNDSFFYDGPVVNYLLHGKYCNPALANVLPISGNEVFCAYPPLYQGVLLGWMKCFGSSELAAMWLHVALLGIFALTVLRIFQQLQVPATAINLAGLFLFAITFHDRPDTLAHVLVALAVLALLRGLSWATAVLLVLTFATSLQIGGIYLLWLTLLLLGNTWWAKAKIPWTPILIFAATLVGLIGWVRFGHPHLWEGFREHVAITPSVTGFRMPAVDDVIKILRGTPGILLVMAVMVWWVTCGKLQEYLRAHRGALLVLSGVITTFVLMGGCLFLLTPNTIHIAGYLQPVIVGGCLALLAGDVVMLKWRRVVQGLFVAAALLVSIRAIGMTTWGVLCARDVSRARALEMVAAELDRVPDGKKVFVSAAYLYEAARRTNIIWLHSDWAAPAIEGDWELRAIQEQRPARLLLTQFDYFRRYERIVSIFQRSRGDVGVQINNTARVQPPDAERATRKVIQHIAWAPVIVEFSWPPQVESK